MDEIKLIEIARDVASKALAPHASGNDKAARYPVEGIRALKDSGLMGLFVPTEKGGLGPNPRAFAGIVETLAQSDASVGMIYTMHVLGAATIAGAPATSGARATLDAIARGEHVTTLAFSEKGSRSNFWAPVSRATKTGDKVTLSAQKSFVTSAGHADSYVVSTLAHAGTTPVESTLYLVPADTPGIKTGVPFDGLGLRSNASASMDFEATVADSNRLTDEGGGFNAKLSTVLPLFNLGASAVALGISRAAVAAAADHLKNTRLEHMDATLAQAAPNLRARLAQMHIETEGLAARVSALVASLENPTDATTLRVLESKAAACEIAIRVTQDAMHLCGGAAFSHNTPVDRHFRDAQAGPIMAPTTDHLHEFLGRALVGLPVFG